MNFYNLPRRISALIKLFILILVILTTLPKLSSASSLTSTVPVPEQIEFPGPGNVLLHGYLYRPAQAKGPAPAVLFNHGSGNKTRAFEDLGKFYTDHGFVFFIPYRRGHGLSADAGTWILDQTKALRAQGLKRPQIAQQAIQLHEQANLDAIAGLKWLRKQGFVDKTRVSVTGLSFGGIQTLLTAEKNASENLGAKCFIAFAPAAQSWNPVLGERLKKAVSSAKAPIFLIQAMNDFSLNPSLVLGPLLEKKGAPNRYKDFPAFGSTTQEGHGNFAVKSEGIKIWSEDVLSFLKECGGA